VNRARIKRKIINNERPASSYGWKVTNEPAILFFIVPGSLARRKGSRFGGRLFWWNREAYLVSAFKSMNSRRNFFRSELVSSQNKVRAGPVGAMPCHAGLGARE